VADVLGERLMRAPECSKYLPGPQSDERILGPIVIIWASQFKPSLT
jgi:hypothetical protein